VNKIGFVIAATLAASVPSVITTPTHGSDSSQNNDIKCKNRKPTYTSEDEQSVRSKNIVKDSGKVQLVNKVFMILVPVISEIWCQLRER
jgi:hypothetical protein